MSEPTMQTFDWADLCKRHEGDAYNEKPVVYEFNGGASTFTEEEIHGFYEVPA